VARFAGGSIQGAGLDYQGFPAGLRPPVSLALAKPVSEIPATDALPGGCLFEPPKWDGFRASIFVARGGVSLWSRQGKDLTNYSVGVNRRHGDYWLVRVQLSVRDRCRSLG
jgi:hypothetical protein